MPKPGSAFVDAVAILKVLLDARTSSGSAAVDANRIRNRTRLGFDECEALLGQMLSAGWVGKIKSDPPRQRFRIGRRTRTGLERWTLLANPQQLRLADVYRLFVFDVADGAPLVKQVERAVEEGLTQTLASHFSIDKVDALNHRTIKA